MKIVDFERGKYKKEIQEHIEWLKYLLDAKNVIELTQNQIKKLKKGNTISITTKEGCDILIIPSKYIEKAKDLIKEDCLEETHE